MAKNKTVATTKGVFEFIAALPDSKKRIDSQQLIDIHRKLTGMDPVLWGPSIIGFGSYHYQYESGREGDMPIAAFSPRKNALVLYLHDFEGKAELQKKLGDTKPGKGCLYVKNLESIDVTILQKMIAASIKHVQKKYPTL